MLKTKVVIIGLGLIGGSIKLALDGKTDCRVIGFDKNKGSNFTTELKTADIIFVATPISQIISTLKLLAQLVKKTTLVTDVASVKAEICKIGKKLFPTGNFIGGHPMAGKETSGFKNAEPNLFENRVWVLEKNNSKLENLIKLIGAKPITVNPSIHDRLVAEISHVPFVVSNILFTSSSARGRNLAAGGFRDTTRLASGNPDLHAEILLANTKNILTSLTKFETNLDDIKKLIRTHDRKKIWAFLAKTKQTRDNWLGANL